MLHKSRLNVLALGLVTFFVTQSYAQQQLPKVSLTQDQQQLSKASKIETVNKTESSFLKSSDDLPQNLKNIKVDKPERELLKATKFLPKILDNNEIDFTKSSESPPGQFLVNKVHGPGSGGGGNSCAMGIVKLTKDLLSQGLDRASLSPEQQQALVVSMKTAKFVEGDNLPKIRGEKKNAINFPDQKLVVVDHTACELITAIGTPGLSLLMHEYMGLAGIDDRDYRVSLSFVEELYRKDPTRYGNKLMLNTAIRADEYMKSYDCLPNQSYAGCLFSAGTRATEEISVVLNQLSNCVDKKSKSLVDNPKENLLKEQAAFWKYANFQQSYLPQNGPHAAQSLHASRLLLILERTDFLKEALQFCTGQ